MASIFVTCSGAHSSATVGAAVVVVVAAVILAAVGVVEFVVAAVSTCTRLLVMVESALVLRGGFFSLQEPVPGRGAPRTLQWRDPSSWRRAACYRRTAHACGGDLGRLEEDPRDERVEHARE